LDLFIVFELSLKIGGMLVYRIADDFFIGVYLNGGFGEILRRGIKRFLERSGITCVGKKGDKEKKRREKAPDIALKKEVPILKPGIAFHGAKI
jgi:hypothetical protein